MIWDLVVIGGGPAGLFAAGEASAHFKKVLLLEKQPEPGRKLLLTGSGQCNFTNIRPLREFLLAYGEHGLFLKPALHQWTNLDSIAFFERYGLESMTVEDTGKVFPRTRRAADVLRVLLKRCQAQGVLMEYHRPVTRVKREADGTFQIFSGTQAYRTRQLLLATGGCSYPATGSTGDGYALAAALGHTCIPPRPGLTSFIIRNFPWTHLPGTSFKNLPLTIWHHDQKLKTLTGDWLITHQGISGPAVQNLSRYACAGDWVTAALVPFASLEVFKREWEARLAHSARLTLKAWLKLFPLTQALARTLLELAELKPAETVARCGAGWLERIDGYRVLHVKGTPYEMGFQHGALLKEEARENMRYLLQVNDQRVALPELQHHRHGHVGRYFHIQLPHRLRRGGRRLV
ncbi:MAG: aminoacetone oxidase family FAD-binding enzyme, partial [Candidatus Firestonebacteria bacterium]|nr:aminoacetone oxidase family FAD-binding enzyme [Candidatus Firestonebacteria bacterium]